MSLFQRSLRLLPLGAVLFLGCSSSSDGGDGSSSSSSSGSSGASVSCANDPRVSTFASGLSAKSASGRFVAEIVTATPSPPHKGAGEAGMNAWMMKLMLDGQPVGADVDVSTLMPDHGHGSPKVPVVSAMPDATSKVETIFLFMGGVWQITFTPKAAREPASFTLCVE